MISQYFESNYQTACNMQTRIENENDGPMKQMIQAQVFEVDKVKDWMRGYGLFQGISETNRIAIAKKYTEVIFKFTKSIQKPNNKEIEELFLNLQNEFYSVVERKWLSATSKLLWCSYPYEIVIYDAYVERALVVLQGITPYLANFPRINNSPKINSKSDIEDVTKVYINYQNMIKAILDNHQIQLDALRSIHQEKYEYDIRIVDKLLWMLGGPNQMFTLGKIKCQTNI
jgi:hypothetical protein